MINPLVINIRCVCIEEFVEIKKLHEKYRKQKIEGEITSAYVGADRKLYGFDKNLDKMLDKVYGDGARPIITERIAKEEPMSEPGLVAGYAEMEEELPCVEEPVPDSMWKEKEKSEITLTDVLVAMAEEPDPMEEKLDAEEGDSYECETTDDRNCEG